MGEFKTSTSAREICRHLDLLRSTYYRWRRKSREGTCKLTIERKIGSLCWDHKFRYGCRKIIALLKCEIPVNHKTVQYVTQKYGCRMKVKKHRRTGQPCHSADDLSKGDFQTHQPFQKLVTDITYLPFDHKQLYLSSIQDLFNGEIITYSKGAVKIRILYYIP